MKATRTEIMNAMANLTAARIRDWATDNLPKNHKLSIVVRDSDQHVIATTHRFSVTTKKWAYTMYVFPGAASDSMIEDVMVGTLEQLASQP